jgi:hypothetical protein
MYYVKVEGKTLADLKRGLERHLQELNGFGEAETVVVKTSSVDSEEVEEIEEMEEVQSPFVSTPPELNTNSHEVLSHTDVDSEGIPWDSRIHASSRAKVGNGTWRLQRGSDKNTVAKVKAELLNRVPVVRASAPLAEVPPVIQAPAPVAEKPPVIQAPAPAPLPQMNHSGHTLDTFKTNFPLILGTLISEKKIDQNYVNQLKDFFKVEEIWMVNDEQKTMMFDQFAQYGFIQKVG